MSGGKRKRPDGTGTFFKTGSGQWIAQIRQYDELTGKSRQIRRRARNRDHARELLAMLRAGQGPRSARTDISFAEYLQYWRDEVLPLQHKAPATTAIYQQCLAYYGIPAAGRIPLAQLTPSACERWLDKVGKTRKLGSRDPVSGVRNRDGEPIAASTVRNTYMAALQALKTAERDGLIASNPLSHVPSPRVSLQDVPVTKPHEVEALLTACQGRRIEPLVHFVSWTGCRIGEALALRWSDVDLNRQTATLRRGGHLRDTTKNSKIRTVTLLPVVVEQLQSAKRRTRRERLILGEGWHDSDLVFTSGSGRALDRDNVSHELKRALVAAGITPKRPWHSLRHGLAHRLIIAGVPLSMVSAMVGHSSVAMTNDIYGHVDATIPLEVLQKAMGQ